MTRIQRICAEKGSGMDAQWRHVDVFPIIARIVRELSSKGDYISHDQIASGLLNDAEGRSAIEEALLADSGSQSAEWLAHNVVAWFSQKITAGQSEWAAEFERIKIDGKWAYRAAHHKSA